MLTIRKTFAIVVSCGVLFGCSSNSDNEDPGPQGNTPNILFFILDDVGIDQKILTESFFCVMLHYLSIVT